MAVKSGSDRSWLSGLGLTGRGCQVEFGGSAWLSGLGLTGRGCQVEFGGSAWRGVTVALVGSRWTLLPASLNHG